MTKTTKILVSAMTLATLLKDVQHPQQQAQM